VIVFVVSCLAFRLISPVTRRVSLCRRSPKRPRQKYKNIRYFPAHLDRYTIIQTIQEPPGDISVIHSHWTTQKPLLLEIAHLGWEMPAHFSSSGLLCMIRGAWRSGKFFFLFVFLPSCLSPGLIFFVFTFPFQLSFQRTRWRKS